MKTKVLYTITTLIMLMMPLVSSAANGNLVRTEI